MLQKHPAAPIYPRPARDAGVAGTVVLEAAIGIDGHIADLEVVSGPPMLRQSALDAVQTWTYRPYLLNGDPVEVHTTINVVFTLGR
jgi:protein TonB